jgi:AraC-like DNA-binding protein
MIQDYQQFELNGKLTFVKAVLKPPFRMFINMEDEACFYFVKSGKSAILSATEKIEVPVQEGVVLQCGRYFNDYLVDENADYCEAIAIHLTPSILKEIVENDYPSFLKDSKMVNYTNEKIKASSLLEHYIESLEFYFANPSLVSDDLLKLKIKELLLLLNKTNNAGIIKTLIQGAYNNQDISFRRTIESNLFNNLSITEFAELTNMSLSSFKREFEKNYHESPAKFIRTKKLEKAAKLLKSTELRISDIAYDSGFGDLASFSKSFLKEYNINPSEYRG